MRLFRNASSLRALALGLGLCVSLVACNGPQQRVESPISHSELEAAREYHGAGAKVDRALILLSKMGEDDRKDASEKAARATKLHVSYLHRVTIDTATIGRRDMHENEAGEMLVTPDSVRSHVGWIAQYSSARGGVVESIFYDKGWKQLAVLNNKGFLTLGGGSNRHTIGYKVDIVKGAEIVYRPMARFGVRTWEEDVAMIEGYTRDSGLTGAYGVAESRPVAKIVRDMERLDLESRPADEFGLFPTSKKD